jgi:predicted short-subunit dehydrogenase-like oxidoreductase (DUF2520 family)
MAARKTPPATTRNRPGTKPSRAGQAGEPSAPVAPLGTSRVGPGKKARRTAAPVEPPRISRAEPGKKARRTAAAGEASTQGDRGPASRAARKPASPRVKPFAFVVGAGRMGSAIARGLDAAGWKVGAWTRTPGPRPHGHVPAETGPLPREIADADLVLLAVPDRIVHEMAERLAAERLAHEGQVVAHLSGALRLAALEPAGRAGAAVGSLHPLVAVPAGDVSLSGAVAALAGDPEAAGLLRRVAGDLGLETLEIPEAQRVRYHAAASLAANGLVALADQAVGVLWAAGVPYEKAFAALIPLLASSLGNLAERGLPDALTGPVARGDAAVVEAHLAALAGTPALPAYRALSRGALSLARAQGKADDAALERIDKLLAEPAPRPAKPRG